MIAGWWAAVGAQGMGAAGLFQQYQLAVAGRSHLDSILWLLSPAEARMSGQVEGSKWGWSSIAPRVTQPGRGPPAPLTPIGGFQRPLQAVLLA